MKVISVNVGLPRPVEYNGEIILTGIFKEPVSGRVEVGEENLAGDRQADLRVHGGWSKAVYIYPAEHYVFWREQYQEMDLPFGIFGENLTTEGLFEAGAFVGDHLRIGTAEFIVTEPRFPCFKLGIRFNRKDVIRKFQKSRRSGIYLAIAKTGDVGVGDAIEFVSRNESRVSIADLVSLREEKNPDLELMRRALEIEVLPPNWKRYMQAEIS